VPPAFPLVGNLVQQQRLVAAADGDRLHHAYLFEGPEGIGKGTFARWLARYVNCEAAERPCGSCRTCHQMTIGTHPDLIEVLPDPDKATRIITAEQAQTLIRSLQLQRHSARRRFVILDPVDALNEESGNALLKTLEEPPRGTHFVLITARVASLLPTIRSRSRMFPGTPRTAAAPKPWLARIATPIAVRDTSPASAWGARAIRSPLAGIISGTQP